MNNKIDNNFPIEKVISIIEKEYTKWNVPVVTLVAMQTRNPFKVLISTIISLRTKDEVTIEASKRIYKILTKPQDIYHLKLEDIEKAIYPCGFYKRKALQIKKICEILVEKYNSQVPKELDELLKFEGVGRKTANLILSEGYNIPAMCVDVHVHRISNRFGYLKSKNPDETEIILRENLDKKYWNKYNFLLVAFGQSICRPISPHCSKCPVLNYCKRINVNKNR